MKQNACKETRGGTRNHEVDRGSDGRATSKRGLRRGIKPYFVDKIVGQSDRKIGVSNESFNCHCTVHTGFKAQDDVSS